MKLLNIFKRIVFVSAAFLLLMSCSKSDESIVIPPSQNQPAEVLTAFEWSKVELQFIEGHAHGMPTSTGGGYFHGNPAVDEIVHTNPVQTLVFENKNGVAVPSPNNKPVRWQGISVVDGKPDPATSLYGLKIIYYDKNGEIINEEFEKDNFQHFFTYSNLEKNINAPKDLVLPQEKSVLNYIYRDTAPLNFMPQNGREVAQNLSKKSVGLKGVFHPTEYGKFVNFTLNIILVKRDNEEIIPFNNPPQRGRLLTLNLPVHIFNDTRENEDQYYENAAKEYGVSAEVIMNEDDIKVEFDPETGVIYM